MIESEAYPDGSDWETRARQKFEKGDRVYNGPAYVGNGAYTHDGNEGLYHVIGELPGHGVGTDYYLSRYENCADWDLIANSSRLVLAPDNG